MDKKQLDSPRKEIVEELEKEGYKVHVAGRMGVRKTGGIAKEFVMKFTGSKENKLDLKEYRTIRHDCDNFSYELMGATSEWCSSLAFGIVWGAEHAFNLFVDENKEVWAVEPQTDEVVPFNDFISPDDVWLIVI